MFFYYKAKKLKRANFQKMLVLLFKGMGKCFFYDKWKKIVNNRDGISNLLYIFPMFFFIKLL